MFFALLPDPIVRARIFNVISTCLGKEGQQTDIENLHLTLAFLGNVENHHITRLYEIAERTCSVRIDLNLDRVIRKSNMIWLTTDQPPVELVSMVSALKLNLQANSFRTDPHRFIAHITLARKVKSSARCFEICPINWPVRSISLMESKNDVKGPRYLELRSWLLANIDA